MQTTVKILENVYSLQEKNQLVLLCCYNPSKISLREAEGIQKPVEAL